MPQPNAIFTGPISFCRDRPGRSGTPRPRRQRPAAKCCGARNAIGVDASKFNLMHCANSRTAALSGAKLGRTLTALKTGRPFVADRGLTAVLTNMLATKSSLQCSARFPRRSDSSGRSKRGGQRPHKRAALFGIEAATIGGDVFRNQRSLHAGQDNDGPRCCRSRRDISLPAFDQLDQDFRDLGFDRFVVERLRLGHLP